MSSFPIPVNATAGSEFEFGLGFVPTRLLPVPDNAALLRAADFRLGPTESLNTSHSLNMPGPRIKSHEKTVPLGGRLGSAVLVSTFHHPGGVERALRAAVPAVRALTVRSCTGSASEQRWL